MEQQKDINLPQEHSAALEKEPSNDNADSQLISDKSESNNSNAALITDPSESLIPLCVKASPDIRVMTESLVPHQELTDLIGCTDSQSASTFMAEKVEILGQEATLLKFEWSETDPNQPPNSLVQSVNINGSVDPPSNNQGTMECSASLGDGKQGSTILRYAGHSPQRSMPSSSVRSDILCSMYPPVSSSSVQTVSTWSPDNGRSPTRRLSSPPQKRIKVNQQGTTDKIPHTQDSKKEHLSPKNFVLPESNSLEQELPHLKNVKPFRSPINSSTPIKQKLTNVDHKDSKRSFRPLTMQDIEAMSENEYTKLRINLLHEYNKVKDIGQMLLGLLAQNSGQTVKDMYERYDLDLED
jgi:hypothetical protein